MKTALFSLLALATVSITSTANARPSTLKMTCQQAANLVSARGAIVLGTGRYTYDRYVAHAGYCGIGETTQPAWVPTRDARQCFIGYTCGQDNRGSGNGG